MLDEVALRGPNFREGYPVVLADGGTWQIPRPLVWWIPSDGPNGFRTSATLDSDDGYEKLLCEYLDLDPQAVSLGIEFKLTTKLLRSNYNLGDDQICEILRFSPEGEGERIRTDLMAIATGRGPKLKAAGGE